MEPNFEPAPEGCEDLEKYRVGGYHPVMIKDTFADGRYVVVHKLGYGGGATVWIARDEIEGRLVALKVLTAESSARTPELKIYQLLQDKCNGDLSPTRLVNLLNHFWVSGPNGEHMCLVFELSGPSLSSLRRWGWEFKVRPEKIRELASQSIQGLVHMHKHGVALSDVSPSNMVFGLDGIQSWTVEHLVEVFGLPEAAEVVPYDYCSPISRSNSVGSRYSDGELGQTDDRDGVREHPRGEVPQVPGPKMEELEDAGGTALLRTGSAPRYVFFPINFLKYAPELVQPEIKFIDLGEAFQLDTPPECEDVGFNLSYAAPEVFVAQYPNVHMDTWGLACCLYELRTGEPLFTEGYTGFIGLVSQMAYALGPLPKEWLRKWWPDIHHSEAEPVAGDDTEEQTIKSSKKVKNPDLKGRLAKIGKLSKWHFMSVDQRRESHGNPPPWIDPDDFEDSLGCFNHPPSGFSRSEARQFHNLLSRMLKYHPAERISLEEVLIHPWVRKEIKASKPRPWLVRYAKERIVYRSYYTVED